MSASLAVSLACADEAAAVGACRVQEDCTERQRCVFLGADERDGTCVQATSTPGFPGPGPFPIDVEFHDELDVLFIVDDSPAIAPRLAQLAGAMAPFVEVLRAVRPAPSLRFAVTTTDAGNPQCATTAERGALRMESCRARLGEFVAEGIDARTACTAGCSLDSLTLRPTPGREGEVAVRPWLEVAPSGDNLPDGVELAEALRCAVPQGVAGCEFTSPLASLEQVIARSEDAGDPAYGFLRETADLLVIVISAGNDCSVAPGHEAIFGDNEVFWGDLQPPDLSPAICWRAGAVCGGPGPVYDNCSPVDRGDDGERTSADAAVLTPTRHFADLLTRQYLLRNSIEIGAEVRLWTVGGVPPDYAEGQAITYADADDPAFQTQHGIGPACSGDAMAAPPAVRLLAASREFGLNAASICEDDWSDAFAQAATVASANLGSQCFGYCVRDADPDTPEIDAVCDFSLYQLGEGSTPVPTCVRQDGEWVSQGGSPRCIIVHTGPDISPRCAAKGSNAEFELRSTEAEPPGSWYLASCWQAWNPTADCPDL